MATQMKDQQTTRDDDAPAILVELARVHDHLGVIAKQQVQSFKAFAIDDVYANIGPLLKREKIVVIPETVDVKYVDRIEEKQGGGERIVIDARAQIRWTFYSSTDGSSVSSTFTAEGRDYQDKATNKAVQQAAKYMLIQMFQIATGEVDPDAAAIEVGGASRDAAAQELASRVTAIQTTLVDQLGGDRGTAKAVWETMLRDVGATDGITPEQCAELEEMVANLPDDGSGYGG